MFPCIKDVWGWLVKAYGWCTSEGKIPLGNGKQVRLVHNPHRGLERGKDSHMREILLGVYVWVKSHI